ncbi:MAG: hypothetical protein REI09_09095 [Candidatus Dactylopiibacterium sp.]|nr:hypothetical protein [Candidatus Dactylopiibacterium sp.]
MFDNYPKVRPILGKEFQDVYAKHYKKNREGGSAASSLSQKMERWLHRQVASDVINPATPKTTLELGAGTLNQLGYEPESGAYDIVEPFVELYRNSPFLHRVRNVYASVGEVPPDCLYDRITSVAVLEHVCELPEVVARSALALSKDGVFKAAIPSEGTLLWGLGWKLTTGLEFRYTYGLDYGTLMRHEHVNTADEIEIVLRELFQDVKCKVFGVSKALSFYRYYECRSPRTDVCRNYLDGLR